MEKSNSNQFQMQLFTWATIGGIIGASAGILSQLGVLIPGITSSSANPVAITLSGTVMGIFIGGALGGLKSLRARNEPYEPYLKENQPTQSSDKFLYNEKFQVKEEQLDINKKMIQTGEVSIHKEVVEEERNITVPIIREELVIENKDIHTQEQKTIRIPITEERVEIIKHPTVLNEVSIYKHKYKKNQQVHRTLKKEKVNVDVSGNPKLKKEDT